MDFPFWFLSLVCSCGLSESLTTIVVEFGQNVTLNCSLAEEDIYWFIQRHSEPPVHILRSFRRTLDVSVHNPEHEEFEDKFSLKTLSRLFIKNVTRSELGSYYCAKVKDHLVFSNGTRLIKAPLNKSIDPNCTQYNHTEGKPLPLASDYLDSWMFIPLVVSCLLNVFITFLFAVVVRRFTQNKKSTSVEKPPDPNSPQYSEIILPASSQPVQNRQISSTYARLQLPACGQSYTTNV